jgi:hypothetical protein
MSTESHAPALAEDQAREIINRWSGAGFFRLRNMGDKIFVDQITPGVAYTIRLQTHYEQRKVRRASEPFHGGAVDDQGRAPDQWEVPVRRPATFEERTEVVPIPHTERVQLCPDCAGERRIGCPGCRGQGRTPCPWCGGMGFIQHQEMDTVRDAQGHALPSARTVRRPCSCSGGQVVCRRCGGNRVIRCPGCDGSGRIKTLDQLVVRFQTATQGEVLDVTPVPDKWLGRLSGEVLVDEQAARIDRCASVPEAVARKAGDLLTESHAVDERQTRIILQLLHVERLPLSEVRYKYAGVERQLWICGQEQDIYAPDAPWNRQRLGWLIAGAVCAVAALVGLGLLLALRS